MLTYAHYTRAERILKLRREIGHLFRAGCVDPRRLEAREAPRGRASDPPSWRLGVPEHLVLDRAAGADHSSHSLGPGKPPPSSPLATVRAPAGRLPARAACCWSSTRLAGIHSLTLNGTTLPAISPAKSYYLIPLPEIEERNILVLEIETSEACEGADEGDPDWGQIAIVVRPIEEGCEA